MLTHTNHPRLPIVLSILAALATLGIKYTAYVLTDFDQSFHRCRRIAHQPGGGAHSLRLFVVRVQAGGHFPYVRA